MAWARVVTKSGKPGFYCEWLGYDGKIKRRKAGDRRADAEAKRDKLLSMGKDAELRRQLAIFDTKRSRVLEEGDDGVWTFAHAARQHIARKKARLATGKHKIKASTVKQDGARLEFIIANAPWSNYPIEEVTSHDIETWLSDREDAGAAASTLNRYLGAISKTFQNAMKKKRAKVNPCRQVERQQEGAVRKQRIKTPDLADQVIACAPDHDPLFREALTLAIYTALRRGELLGIRWDDVSLDERTIYVSAELAKTHSDRVVDLGDEALAAMTRLAAAAKLRNGGEIPADHFVVSRNGTKSYPAITLRRLWLKTRANASMLPAKLRRELRWHDLRHCLPSWMVSNGQTIAVTAALIGDSIATTSKHYAHLASDARAESFRQVSEAIRRGRRSG